MSSSKSTTLSSVPPTPRESTRAEIVNACDLLLERDSVAELRIPGTRRTLSGFFDDFDILADAAFTLNGRHAGIYITLNPVRLELLPRSENKIRFAKQTTTDADILSRRWLPLDFDPARPAHTSSSDQEHDAALARAQECRDWLRDLGWPIPVFADSGNGAHVLFPIEMPNDDRSAILIRQTLAALDFHFSDNSVQLDLNVYNGSRIWKLYGTWAQKGASSPERPYRKARILRKPPNLEVVGIEFLEALAAMTPAAVPTRRHA